MSELKKSGTKCHICTGCGRCVAEATHTEAVSVVTHRLPDRAQVCLRNRAGERLVAVDIGTTTIAMQLYREDGSVEEEYVCVNPQVRYGADVLSRVRAASETVGGAEIMRQLVLDKLQEGILSFRGRLKPDEDLCMVLAGNTTMIYLLMGFDTEELGHAPFAASHLEAIETELAGVRCFIFPGLSAFVGGDITAGMYAGEMTDRSELTLLLDLGTNGELVLGNDKRQVACATAAGPAFEGGVNRGVWGADMVHLLARLREDEILDETGLLSDDYFDTGIRIGNVHITQESVRAIQLAKGAIGAGIRILMKEYGLGEDYTAIDRVVLAGGFGYYLQPEDAARIGLLPGELVSRTMAGGNTALAGALRIGGQLLGRTGALRDWKSMTEELLPGRNVEVINLAEHPDFERLYLDHMNLAGSV